MCEALNILHGEFLLLAIDFIAVRKVNIECKSNNLLLSSFVIMSVSKRYSLGDWTSALNGCVCVNAVIYFFISKISGVGTDQCLLSTVPMLMVVIIHVI